MPKLNTKTSIIDYLKSIWEDYKYPNRKKIAETLWIENYRGTTEQNLKMISLYQKQKEDGWDVEKEVQKALSSNDLKTLEEAVKKYWKNAVLEKLKDKPNFKEIEARIKESTVRNEELDNQTVSDRSWTDKIIEDNKPQNPAFPQYKPFEVSDEERTNIEETQKSYNQPFFDRENSRLTEDYNVNKLSLDRLIQYSKTDTARDLAKINKTFAKTMSKASQAYWRRNILWSWIQIQQAWESVESLWKDEYNRQEYARRQEEWLETRQANIKTKFDRWLTEISENQDAQTYFDTLKEIGNRQSEYTRQFWQSQENTNFNITTPTTPKATWYSWTDANKKVLNSNYR